jgi:putative membrane protein
MKNSFLTTPRLAAVCAAALCSSLMAQTETVPTSPTITEPRADVTPRFDVTPRADVTTKLSHSDKTFIEKAAKGGMKEVAISQAVSAKLTGPGVREFAQMMINDHGAANTELAALAARKGVTLPTGDDGDAKHWAKNDKDVDDEYLEQMKDDHKQAIDVFERGAKTEDAEIAAFAQKMLPKLQAHLEQIKALKKVN